MKPAEIIEAPQHPPEDDRCGYCRHLRAGGICLRADAGGPCPPADRDYVEPPEPREREPPRDSEFLFPARPVGGGL